jgi:hypothetical protein
MASYEAHVLQAKNNFKFIGLITNTNNYEWQVTVCFYVAVHLINAHIAKLANQHFRTHNQVEEAINPYNILSITKLSEDQFKAYVKLQNLSRRARYLIHDDITNLDSKEFFTYSKHLGKAIKNLEIILAYFENAYGEKFESISVQCIDLKNKYTSKYFKIM